MIEIPLTRGHVAVIDDGDAELVSPYKWRALAQPHTCYAIARLPRFLGKQRTLYMHRLIMHAGPGERVAHENHDGLMNFRANLRVRPVGIGAMRPAAGRPTSRQEGVTWDAEARKWSASFEDREGKWVHIGLFDTEWRAILNQDFALMRDGGLVPDSMSFERFLACRPSPPNGGLSDVEQMLEQSWREREGAKKTGQAVRRSTVGGR